MCTASLFPKDVFADLGGRLRLELNAESKQMKVGEVCKGNVVTIEARDELVTAAQRMRERHVGYLVVVEPFAGAGGERSGARPIGVLTDRDLVVTVMARGVDASTLKVEDVMTRRPVTVREDEMLSAAIGRMRGVGVRRLPVVDSAGALVGIIALDDVLDFVAGQLESVVGSIRQEQRTECALRQ
jgi:predicted transcriptional regulator